MLLAQYLDNACKYAEFDSTITVVAETANEEVLLSVHSFGPVIPMADRERIFDRYYRSSNSSSHTPGTGIGLSIAKRAALAHGGSVWVSSDEAEGTTFFAALPARSPHSTAGSASDWDSGSGDGTGTGATSDQATVHPADEDLSVGTPAHHPTDNQSPVPALERSIL
jgi:signal transduction histidine kinase